MGISITSTFDILRFPDLLDENIRKHMKKASKQIATLLTKTARNTHRYNHRTRKLRSATFSKTIDAASAIIIKTYIDDSIAPHGKFIHDGTGTWSADPFINNAITTNWIKIQNIINKHVDDAINESLE